MASRDMFPVQALRPEVVTIDGSFAPNGASAVSAASNKGKGWSVARTSAGLFTLTLEDVYHDIVSVTATLQLATGADQFAQVGSISVASKTIEIRVWDVSGAAVTDVAADANNRVNFAVVCRNSPVSY